ncbi:MAG: hypothetical protein GY946_01040, partial [bacterium]|nr:hypothetical protein [bacterium]
MTDKLTTVQPTAIVPADQPNITELMSLALKQDGGGADALAKLVTLQERVMDRQALDEGRRAFGRCKTKLPDLHKTHVGNPKHVSKRKARLDGSTYTAGGYKPLSEIEKEVRGILANEGFVLGWDHEKYEDKMYVVCILTHELGYEKRGRFPSSVDDGGGRNSIQSVASGESYAKRYSLLNVLGLTVLDADDDGNSHGQQADAGPPISEHDAANIASALEELGADVPAFCRWLGA